MKRALVTGASGVIGSAIARRLAADKHLVYLHAHRGLDKIQPLIEAIHTSGGHAIPVSFDITDGQATRAALEKILDEGPVQILVNNAGIHDDGVFPGLSEAQWHGVIDLTVNGFYHVTQPLILPMIRTRWGRIINISSLSGIYGNHGQVNYSAAKGALNSATKALAQEVASRGITVNAVAPGIIETEDTMQQFDQDSIMRMVPMKRAGKPEEVADLVGFLASEQAAYITSQIISINGGIG